MALSLDTPLLASKGITVQVGLATMLVFVSCGTAGAGVIVNLVESITLLMDSSKSLALRPAVTTVGSMANSMMWPFGPGVPRATIHAAKGRGM